MTNSYLIVGLGNPGAEYAGHRHNVGFMALDRLAASVRAESFSKKFHGEVAQAVVGSQKLLLLKPHTYMNHSGRAVQAAAAFYKIPPKNIIVLHDELDLPVGKLRIKKGGGANGQNGIRDIDAAIGQEYWRIRFGIGHPGDKEKVHGHVLSGFGKEDRVATDALINALTRYFPLFWEHSPEALMSKVTDDLKPPREKKPATNRAPADKATTDQ